jgi:hypothetical protein
MATRNDSVVLADPNYVSSLKKVRKIIFEKRAIITLLGQVDRTPWGEYHQLIHIFIAPRNATHRLDKLSAVMRSVFQDVDAKEIHDAASQEKPFAQILIEEVCATVNIEVTGTAFDRDAIVVAQEVMHNHKPFIIQLKRLIIVQMHRNMKEAKERYEVNANVASEKK